MKTSIGKFRHAWSCLFCQNAYLLLRMIFGFLSFIIPITFVLSGRIVRPTVLGDRCDSSFNDGGKTWRTSTQASNTGLTES
jgi:hypothetical protein